jgi:hypothetical protein
VGKIFTITQDIRDIARDVLDDFLTELGKKVKLVYAARRHVCPNCLLGPDNKSAGLYRSGGPVPFVAGQPCPVCGGEGWVTDAEQTEIVQASVAWKPADWFVPVPYVGLPSSTFQIKVLASDWGKVSRAREVVVAPDLGGLDMVRAKLERALGDPSNMVPGRYAVGQFQRTG